MINMSHALRPKAALMAICYLLLVLPVRSTAQLTLEDCYQRAQSNYPLTRQRELIEKTRQYTIDNIAKGVYPQFAVSGTATYQSDVTKIAVPGYNIPSVSKDQYKVYGEVSQTLTDFGINRQKRVLSSTDAEIQQENLNVQLYALKDRVNQLFFGALLIDGQIEQNDLSKQDIQAGIAKVRAKIANGTDFNSSLNKLKAELLKADQRTIDLRASRKAYTDMLSLFIDQPVTDTTVLVRPVAPALTDSINRPELRAYDLQTKYYAAQRHLTKINNYPQLNAFFQGGLGKPSPVNFLSTQLTGYYLTGLRLSWNIGGLYTYKKDQLINRNNQELVQSQRSTFLFNTSMTMRQQHADIDRYQALIRSDEEIIKLRTAVKQASSAQLENGVLSANDYLTDINAESQARQDRALHSIQLLMAEFNYKTTGGN